MDLGSTLSPLQAQVREGMEYVFARAGLTGDRALRITKKKKKKGEILIVKTFTHVKSIETKQKKRSEFFLRPPSLLSLTAPPLKPVPERMFV